MTGTKTRSMKLELTSLAVFLVIAYSTATQDRLGEEFDRDRAFITLELKQVIIIGVWFYLAVIITSTFKESKFIALVYW